MSDQQKAIVKKKQGRIKSTFTIYAMCANASLGIFFLGFNQGVFNVSQLAIMYLNDITNKKVQTTCRSIMTAANPLGGMIGAFSGAAFLHIVGGLRKSLMILDVLGVITTIIEICSVNIYVIVVGRFLCGIIAGINSALVPVYMKEFSPLEMSGRTGSFVQFGQKTGLLIAYLVGFLLPSKDSLTSQGSNYDDTITWRIVVGFPGLIFCIIRFTLMLFWFNYETPVALLHEHHEQTLNDFLKKVYKSQAIQSVYRGYVEKLKYIEHKEELEKEHLAHLHDEKKPHDNQANGHSQEPQKKQENAGQLELTEQKKKEEQDQQNAPSTQKNPQTNNQLLTQEEPVQQFPISNEDLEKETLWRRRALGWIIALTVSFSGIDAIYYYSNNIYEEGGIEEYATIITVGIGAASVIFSFIGFFLVDIQGRKPLIIIGSFIICLALAMMVVSDALSSVPSSLIAVLFHLLGYNSTIGPVKWGCFVELMDPFGIGVASALIFIFACVVALIFPFMVDGIGLEGGFAVFLGLSVVCFIYLLLEMKETKGKTFPEICNMFYGTHKEVEEHHTNALALRLHACEKVALNYKSKDRK